MAVNALNGLRLGPGPAAGTPARTPDVAAAPPDEAKAVSRQFEAMFVELLLRQMRSAARGLSGAEKGFASDVYDGWYEQQVAQRIVAGGGIGLSDSLSRALQVRYNGGNAGEQ